MHARWGDALSAVPLQSSYVYRVEHVCSTCAAGEGEEQSTRGQEKPQAAVQQRPQSAICLSYTYPCRDRTLKESLALGAVVCGSVQQFSASLQAHP
jgi:hypothetical protein